MILEQAESGTRTDHLPDGVPPVFSASGRQGGSKTQAASPNELQVNEYGCCGAATARTGCTNLQTRQGITKLVRSGLEFQATPANGYSALEFTMPDVNARRGKPYKRRFQPMRFHHPSQVAQFAAAVFEQAPYRIFVNAEPGDGRVLQKSLLPCLVSVLDRLRNSSERHRLSQATAHAEEQGQALTNPCQCDQSMVSLGA